ncbi:hypothetical protein FRC01_003401 [Tulasnella sp. 417]|nr:hypothetical protein FRC01_003401 [Tulasnella sp. 417]
MGVLLSGERPPKEPLAAADGTSYLQLWNEASKCWDEDPTLRPSITSVLARLDHKRAEEWIAAQHIAIETSLNPAVNIEPTSTSALIAKARETTDTLRWADSIRARLATFMNSKQPISRMTPDLLACIILQDNTAEEFFNGHPLETAVSFISEGKRLRAQVSRMFRAVQLRRVSRAWRLAIDTSTQLCSFVWVGNNRNNLEYIQNCNPDGPLECAISRRWIGSPASIPQPIAHRISQIAIASPNHYTAELLKASSFPNLNQLFIWSMSESNPRRDVLSLNAATNPAIALVIEHARFSIFEPTVFLGVHTVKIFNTFAHDTFIPDLFAVLSASPNLAELVLDRLFPDLLHASTPLHLTHRGLKRMRLRQIPSPLLSALLIYLDLENIGSMLVDGIEPRQFPSPDSAFAKTIQGLLRSTRSPENNGELWLASAVRPDENILLLRWPTKSCVFGDKPPTTWETWDFNVIKTSHLSNVNAMKLFHDLLDLGIKVARINLDLNDSMRIHGEVLDRSLGLLSPESALWLEILNRLDCISTMVIGVSVLDTALKHLSEPVPGRMEGSRYVCPHLTRLEVFGRTDAPKTFREHIGRRQQAAGSLEGPAKLKKIGVPASWINQIKLNGSIFEDVELYSANLRLSLPYT